ncbi:MAG TPA: hypothetical protein PLW44_17415 [Chitinophagales bacterium]|nr:hypothetical protein [Chitinophagales bacterium]
MKKLLVALSALTLIISFSACKKCFRCYNDCQQCILTINNRNFYKTLCSDSFNTRSEYNAALAADSAYGYVCAPTSPTYDYDYCTNQPGKDSYTDYFTKGGRATCDAK